MMTDEEIADTLQDLLEATDAGGLAWSEGGGGLTVSIEPSYLIQVSMNEGVARLVIKDSERLVATVGPDDGRPLRARAKLQAMVYQLFQLADAEKTTADRINLKTVLSKAVGNPRA